jgi:CRP-like cAMP-binding protein
LFLFEKLTDHQLEQLCEKGHVELIEPGPVFAEGEVATCFYVLIEGELVLSKLSGGEEIEFSRTSQRGVYSGAWQSYLGDRAPQTYTASMRVTAPSRFFVLDADRFGQLMREWFPMAVHLLEGLFFGSQNAKQVVDQRERLLALGSLSAGLTHELNNPAATSPWVSVFTPGSASRNRAKDLTPYMWKTPLIGIWATRASSTAIWMRL